MDGCSVTHRITFICHILSYCVTHAAKETSKGDEEKRVFKTIETQPAGTLTGVAEYRYTTRGFPQTQADLCQSDL